MTEKSGTPEMPFTSDTAGGAASQVTVTLSCAEAPCPWGSVTSRERTYGTGAPVAFVATSGTKLGVAVLAPMRVALLPGGSCANDHW